MSLNNLTAEQVRVIAARYQIPVTGEVGNRAECTSFFWLCMLLFIPVLTLFVFAFINAALGTTPPLALTALFVVGGSIIADWISLFQLFLVSVPKLGAAIVLDRFTKVYHTCIQGWNIVYPWEQYYWGTDNLSQRATTVKKTTEFLTKDGVSVSFSWTVQEGPYLPLLALNIRFDDEDVSKAVTEIVENTISEEILDVNAAQIMAGHIEIDDLQQGLLKAMQGDPPERRDQFGSSIEERVGSNMEIATLGPPTFAGDYKAALVTRKSAEVMEQAALSLVKTLKIDGGQALDTVLMLNKEGVKKDIFKIEADNNTKELAEHLGRFLGKVGTVASRLPGSRR